MNLLTCLNALTLLVVCSSCSHFGSDQPARGFAGSHLTPETKLVHRWVALHRCWSDLDEDINRKQKGWGDSISTNLIRALDKLSVEERKEVAEELDPYAPRMGSFHEAMLRSYVVRLAREKEYKALIAILARTCPEYIGSLSIEEFLARTAGDEAIEIMKEVYDIASDPAKRAFWAAIFQCAFPSLRKQFPDDDLFIQACAKWYRENKRRLRLNPNYLHETQSQSLSNGLYVTD